MKYFFFSYPTNENRCNETCGQWEGQDEEDD